GPVRLESVEPSAPDQEVFNLEVGREHTYRVSDDLIWAHNNCFVDRSLDIIRKQYARVAMGERVGGNAGLHSIAVNGIANCETGEIIELGYYQHLSDSTRALVDSGEAGRFSILETMNMTRAGRS